MLREEYSPVINQFLYSIKSKETQKIYLYYIHYFEEFINRKIEDLLALNPRTIEETLIQYIIHMRDKGLSYSSITSRLAAVLSFLSINDVSINQKKLKKFVGEKKRTVKDQAYTRDDIAKMLEHSSFRTKVIILIFSSTGIRKSALVELKLKHLEKIDGIYKFTIYENTSDEYVTFCTPECALAIDEYIAQRKKAGEKITQDSWLIRNDYDYLSFDLIRNPKQLDGESVALIIQSLLAKINMRQVVPKTEDKKYKRHEKPSLHAFRKYFNTCLANCDVNVTIKEMLMGHSVGLDDSYFRPTGKQLLDEYMKAVNELTINEENRLKEKVSELQEKQDEIDLMKLKHDREMKEMREEMDKKFGKLDMEYLYEKIKKLEKQMYASDGLTLI